MALEDSMCNVCGGPSEIGNRQTFQFVDGLVRVLCLGCCTKAKVKTGVYRITDAIVDKDNELWALYREKEPGFVTVAERNSLGEISGTIVT